MLQAIIKNKARKFFREHARRPQEDIATSCLFGPLAYMPPEQAGTFLSWIMPERPELQGARVEDVRFWQRSVRQDSGDRQREPDVIIEMRGLDGRALDLLVEVKWASGKLGEEQARDQWRLFGPGGPDQRRPSAGVLHAFVVDDPNTVRDELSDEADELARKEPDAAQRWREAQTVLGWFEIAERLHGRSSGIGQGQTGRLAADVASLLHELGKRPFGGFLRLPHHAVSAPPLPVFFGAGRRRRFVWPALPVEALGERGIAFFSRT